MTMLSHRLGFRCVAGLLQQPNQDGRGKLGRARKETRHGQPRQVSALPGPGGLVPPCKAGPAQTGFGQAGRLGNIRPGCFTSVVGLGVERIGRNSERVILHSRAEPNGVAQTSPARPGSAGANNVERSGPGGAPAQLNWARCGQDHRPTGLGRMV